MKNNEIPENVLSKISHSMEVREIKRFSISDYPELEKIISLNWATGKKIMLADYPKLGLKKFDVVKYDLYTSKGRMVVYV